MFHLMSFFRNLNSKHFIICFVISISSIRYGTNWKPFLMRVAYSAIKDATTAYSSDIFFQQRYTIESALVSKLSGALLNSTNGAVQLMNFQLRHIDLESSVSIFYDFSTKI